MESLLQIAAINSIKTGNPIIDFAMITTFPFFCSLLLNQQNAQELFKKIKKMFETPYKGSYRSIKDTRTFTQNGYFIGFNKTRNEILQKAIMMYLGKTKWKQNKASVMYDYPNKFDGKQPTVEDYNLSLLPIEGKWVFIQPDLELKFTMNEGTQKTGKDNVVYKFGSLVELRTLKTQDYIDEFLDKVQKWYIEVAHPPETCRFIYNPIVSEETTVKKENQDQQKSKKNSLNFKKYKLSDHKTFKSLFFPQKNELIKLIDDFTNKTGKYSIAGYPNKLGFLLHGEPGTGKTTFIKALAHYTKRHIVTVPLSKISTNQELFDIMFDLSFNVVGSDFATTYTFKDIIFIMEDIDAASKVVYQRKPEKENFEDLIDSDDDTDPTIVKFTKWMSKQDKTCDKLDLSGVLNVLDGVIDTEDRIIIMTSNFPDKLDTALIRPGRIDKKIELSFIKAPEIEDMLKLYFPGDEIEDKKLLSKIESRNYTPAQIEQKCSEYSCAIDMLKSL